jgi:hypothetical protein
VVQELKKKPNSFLFKGIELAKEQEPSSVLIFLMMERPKNTMFRGW